MGINMMGRWEAQHAPALLKYPFKAAAKLATGGKLSANEANALVTDTRRIHDAYLEQETVIRELRKELNIAEQTVKLLQVNDG